MKFSVYGESWASRIRQFWDDLFTSRHVRFLEAELARVRVEKDAQIQMLQTVISEVRISALRPTMDRVDRIDQKKWAGVPLSNYEAELAAHNKALEEEEKEEKNNGVQKQ